MSPKDNQQTQNVWFGVAMFLLGIIAGAVLTITSGAVSLGGADKGAPSVGGAPTAPTAAAPNGQQQANVNDRMVAYAQDIGLDKDAFESCMKDDADGFKQKIDKETQEGQASGVNGTPGNILYNLKTKKARLVSGAQPIANFEKNIDHMLQNPSADPQDQSAQAVTNVTPVDLSTDHVTGDRNASIAIIEYTDYQCPFCHAVHPTHKALLEKYDGKVMWVMRHYPLSFHPEAMPLATGAECAGKIGGNDAFWAFTDKVMSE